MTAFQEVFLAEQRVYAVILTAYHPQTDSQTKKTKPNIGTVFTTLCQLTLCQLYTEQLVNVITSCTVCIQCNTIERNRYVTI